ncbi:MAG: PD-(D/E)XK nuclease family protein [Proteobacteria bacterium]|nr:PD-(D/E)XK nuclease family protein [Pseudomonadota bacterium]
MSTALNVLRTKPHLSFSQLYCFSACSRQYEYRYIQKIAPAHKSASLCFGSALHQVLEFYYVNYQKPGTDELQDRFRDAWKKQLASSLPIQYGKDETSDGLLDKGVELLSVFKKKAPAYGEIVSVEQPFTIEVIDFTSGEVLPPVIGAFDLVTRDNGQVTVTDHKSCKQKWDERRLAQDLQLSSYHYAAGQLGYGDVRLGVNLLMKKKKADFLALHTHRNESHHRDFIDTCIGVWRGINAGVSYPVKSWMCSSCSYREVCER